MISLDHAVVARLDSHGERFEILVDPRQAALVRQGQPVNIEDVVAALNVFGNASKATRASDEALMKVFHTTDFATIARRIIEKGRDPPHCRAAQADDRGKAPSGHHVHCPELRSIPRPGIPTPRPGSKWPWKRRGSISIPSSTLTSRSRRPSRPFAPSSRSGSRNSGSRSRSPPDFAAKAYGDIAAGSIMEKDEWQKDGSWVCVVRIPAGIQGEFYDLINKLSKGEGQVKILNQVY